MDKIINKKIIDIAKRKALSGEDILKLVKGQSNILLYRELYKYDNLEDVLGKYKSCVLLYETTQPLYGHWCVVFQQDRDTIEFMDSYGYLIDTEISNNFMNKEILKNFYSQGPILRKLIYYSKYKYIVYNNHRLQERKIGVNTCGRWVVCRLLFRDLTLEEFIGFMKSFNMNLDDLVTIITLLV